MFTAQQLLTNEWKTEHWNHHDIIGASLEIEQSDLKKNDYKSIPRTWNSVSDVASIYFCVKVKMMVISSPVVSYHLPGHRALKKHVVD